MEQTFEEWMALVNAELEAEFGFDSEHLPDLCYYDFYEDEMEPSEIVSEMYEMI